MANSVLCTECENWVHGRCAVTRLAMHFICLKCWKEWWILIKKLCNEVETVNGVYCLGDRLNSIHCCEATVTARIKICWIRFREC